MAAVRMIWRQAPDDSIGTVAGKWEALELCGTEVHCDEFKRLRAVDEANLYNDVEAAYGAREA